MAVYKNSSYIPSDPDFEILSLPARSTKFNLPATCAPVILLFPFTVTVKIECDRLDFSFIEVRATVRFFVTKGKYSH